MKSNNKLMSTAIALLIVIMVMNYALAILIPMIPYIAGAALLLGFGWLVYARRTRL